MCANSQHNARTYVNHQNDFGVDGVNFVESLVEFPFHVALRAALRWALTPTLCVPLLKRDHLVLGKLLNRVGSIHARVVRRVDGGWEGVRVPVRDRRLRHRVTVGTNQADSS